jgi:hypothetical protein
MGSKLRNYIFWDDVQAEKGYFDQIGQTNGQVKRSRNEDTRLSNPAHSRVRVTPIHWYDAILVDPTDLPRIVADPSSRYKQIQAASAGRWIDGQILDAALGTAYTGESGGTSTTFDTVNNVVAVASSGLSTTKLASARKIFFGTYDVDPDMARLHCDITEKQAQELLAETKTGSSDYNIVKPLVDGSVASVRWMGFQFHLLSTSVVPTDGDSYRRVVCWEEMGLAGGMIKDISTDINVRPDKVNAIQILTECDCGFCRLEQARVVEIKCSEA